MKRQGVKRIFVFALCVMMLLALAGCSADTDGGLRSGFYFLDCDDEMGSPYVHLNVDENTFELCSSMMTSYSESGSFQVIAGQVIALTQNTSFIFQISEDKTLVLVGNNDFFDLPENAEFTFQDFSAK